MGFGRLGDEQSGVGHRRGGAWGLGMGRALVEIGRGQPVGYEITFGPAEH